MRANLDLTKGLIVSEAVMMGLGPHLGRQYAHDLVYDICRKVVATGRPLLDLLAENAEITKHLDRSALANLCDPAKPAPWWTGCWRGGRGNISGNNSWLVMLRQRVRPEVAGPMTSSGGASSRRRRIHRRG